MRKELFVEIDIPEGVNVSLSGNEFEVSGKEGSIKRSFNMGRLEFKISQSKIIIGNKFSTKTEKRMMNTIASHLKNMISGVQEKWEYELKVCYGHFPFTVKQNGKEIIIKNFLGEKVERKVNPVDGVDVSIEKDIIKLRSTDKEKAGQYAANFEFATKIKGRDKRIFQDGVYIIKKCGKEI